MKLPFPLALLAVFVTAVDARPPARQGRSTLLASTPSVARIRAQATKLQNGQVLVSGSQTPGSTQLDLFNPATDTFTHVANDAIPRSRHTATLLADGRVLLAGGLDFASGTGVPTNDCRIFDPTTNTVSLAGSMATARFDFTATLLLDGRVLVTGSRVGTSSDTETCEIYNPATNSWSAAATMFDDRAEHAAVLLANGKVLVIGNESRGEVYDPATNTFTRTPSSIDRHRPSLTRLGNGKVVIIGSFLGGNDRGLGGPSVEIYDPATNTFAPAGTMPYHAGGVSASFLPDGRILVIGNDVGAGFVGPPFTQGSVDAQIYDPVAMRGMAVRNLRKPRLMAPSVALDDGRVLIVGGDNPLASQNAEVWDPTLLGSARGNIDLDLRGDILWNNVATNESLWWDMNGFAGNQRHFPMGSDSALLAAGEFDGGGSSDLYVNRPGTLGIRGHFESPVDGSLQPLVYNTALGTQNIAFQPSQMILKPRDINGDGRDDVFTQDPGTGQVSAYLSHAPERRGIARLPTVAEPGWILAAIDDFDADGMADVLWRHSGRGENYIWFVDGNRLQFASPADPPYTVTIPRAGQTVPVPDQNYQVKGTGDFNGDGKADLVWRYDAVGHTIVWLMDGVSANGAPVPAPGVGFQFVSAVDFDGDEKHDILWRNPTTGENAICLMNGFAATCGGIPPVLDANWRMIMP